MPDFAKTFAGASSPLIVAHDAGAANIIFSWVQDSGEIPAICCEGPAASIAARLGFAHEGAARLEAMLARADCVLSGTGWASDLEHRARILARKRDIRSIAVLDHWTNYRQRFERDGVEVLPDELWVTDGAAHQIACKEFPGIALRLQSNRYLEMQAGAAGPVLKDGDLLFIGEPARSDWGMGRPGEFQALDYLVANAFRAGIPENVPLRIRPHPSEPLGKYDDWLASHSLAKIDVFPDLAAAIAPARFVAGMNSAALQVGLASGRTTICALPPHAPACVLPLPNLVHLRNLTPNLEAF